MAYRFVEGVAIIVYRYDDEEEGEEHEWGVGVNAAKTEEGGDSDETMRDHLKRWRPNAIFLRCSIKPFAWKGTRHG